MVDASVGIKILVEEELSDRAWKLFEYLTREPAPRFFVPDHFYIECANVLWKYVRQFGHSRRAAGRALADFLDFPFHVVSTRSLALASLDLGLVRGIAAYDSAYVTLAHSLELPLVTADEALLRRLAGTPFDARWLGHWP